MMKGVFVLVGITKIMLVKKSRGLKRVTHSV